MTVLYTSGNTNLSTVRLVAHEIQELIQTTKYDALNKVILFSSPETISIDVFAQQIEIYEQYFGNNIRVEKVPLSKNGFGEGSNFTDVFRFNDLKLVDISNGQKTTTAQLYIASSLLRVDNIFYLSLHIKPSEMPENPVKGKHYDYIKVPLFSGIADLSRLSYFDLIFYMDEIDEIFERIEPDSFLGKIAKDLRKSIFSFFEGYSFRSAISDATTISEVFIKELLGFLKGYSVAQKICLRNAIDLDKQQDPLGAVTFFFRKYSDECSANPDMADRELEALLTVPGLLTPIRSFRNLSAHAGASPHHFQSNEARICINLSIQILHCAKLSEEFWKRLKTR